MSRGSNVAAFALNLIFIILGIGGLGIFFWKNKGECHRFLAIFLGSYLTQIFFLSLLYHITSRSQKVYDENTKAGKVVGGIFWLMFVLNLIVSGLIGVKIYFAYKDTLKSGNSLSLSFGSKGSKGSSMNSMKFSTTEGGVRNRNSNLHYRKY